MSLEEIIDDLIASVVEVCDDSLEPNIFREELLELKNEAIRRINEL